MTRQFLLPLIVALSPGMATAGAARDAHIQSRSAACQTEDRHGAQLTESERACIPTFVTVGLKAQRDGVAAFGGATRDLPQVQAEVCSSAVAALFRRAAICTPPSSAELGAALMP